MAKEEPQADQVGKPDEQKRVAVIVGAVAIAVLVTIVSIWPAGATWIQNLILLATAAVVVWYTLETADLRKETQNMVKEAKRSREQAEAAGVVDAEIRLHEQGRLGMSWSELETLRTDWIPSATATIFNVPYAPSKPGLRALLESKQYGTAKAPDTYHDATFSVERILSVAFNPTDYPGIFSAIARGDAAAIVSGPGTGSVEIAFGECEFFIRLMDGPSESASRVASRYFKPYERLQEVLLSYLALQKLVTGDGDYGETYLAYLEKSGTESLGLIQKIRMVGSNDATTN